MEPDVNEFLERVKRVRNRYIPSSARIVAETFVRLGLTRDDVSPEQARANFNDYLLQVFHETLATLEDYERPVYSVRAISELANMRQHDLVRARQRMRQLGDDDTALQAAVQELIEDWYYHLRQLFLSVSQSRKTRGGKDFELQIAEVLRLSGFPFEPQHREYRVDFMMPSYEHYSKDRTQCVLVSAKRTLRERWQEVVDELQKMNCPNVYLATTDDNISASKKNDIARRNIKLAVFDEVKNRRFGTDPMVVSYTYLANNVIPTWQQFWSNP